MAEIEQAPILTEEIQLKGGKCLIIYIPRLLSIISISAGEGRIQISESSTV